MSKKQSHQRNKRSPKHSVANTKRRAANTTRDATNATIDSQIAFLESQIALLKDEQQVQNAERKVKSEKNKSLCTSRSALPAPVLSVPTTAGDSIFLRWSEVAGADYIEIELAYDAAFTERAGGMSVDGSRTWATLPEMTPDKTWFIHVRALGSDASMSSVWSNARSIRTLPEGMAGTNDETATHLQSWLDEQQTLFQNFSEIVPDLANTVLTTSDHRRLRGSGVRRYGFIDKVSDVSAEFPQFWLGSVNGEGGNVDFQDKLKERLREIEVLRNLLAWQRFVNRVTGDLLLLAGDDAFRMARTYYASVRAAARSQLPGAQQVYQLLNLFWRRPRRASDEPTMMELERDFRRVLHGMKDGIVSAQHESPTTSGGVHEVIDNVHSARCRVKETVKQSQHE